MSQLTLTQINNGDTPDASILMANLNTLKNRINLGMEADNIAAGAVNGSHINLGAYIFKQSKGADVASAATVTLGNDGNFFDITGTTTITSITAKTAGTVVQLQFDSSLTLTMGSNLNIDGNFLTSTGATIELISDGTNWFEISRSPKASPITGSYKNLVISRTNATTVAVTADEIILNNGKKISSVSFSVAITTSGVGGLDTGAEAGNTIYYIYALSASTGIISTSASAPSGQTVYALIGAVGNDNSSNFIAFKQEGTFYQFTPGVSMASGSTASAWTAIDLTPATMTFFVPPSLSTIVYGSIWHETGKNAAVSNINTESTVAAGTTGTNKLVGAVTGFDQAPWRLHVLTADTLYWNSDNAANNIYIHGFEINKL